jgi:hypothetical protein
MKNAWTFFVPAAVVFLLFFSALNTLAGEKISVVRYELKPLKAVDSGRYIKTEWNAKLRNGVSEHVRFSVTIVFIDKDNETLKEATSQCELKAHETKAFKDTILVETDIANRIVSTKLTIKETTE